MSCTLEVNAVMDFANLEVWQELETAIDARYIKGNFFKRDSVVLEHGGACIQLCVTYFTFTKQYYTQISAKLPSRAKFSFEIKRKSLLSGLARFVGIEKIEVGHPEIDARFVVTGSDKSRIQGMFRIDAIRENTAHHLEASLTLSDGLYLEFTETGIIRDIPRLVSLFRLFVAIIDFTQTEDVDDVR